MGRTILNSSITSPRSAINCFPDGELISRKEEAAPKSSPSWARHVAASEIRPGMCSRDGQKVGIGVGRGAFLVFSVQYSVFAYCVLRVRCCRNTQYALHATAP